jgi:hypothetical protein
MTFSALAWMVASKRLAIARIEVSIFVGPKKLYSIHGMP